MIGTIVVRSLAGEGVYLIEPILTAKEILTGHAQLHLTASIQKFNLQVLALELKSRPQLLQPARRDSQSCLILASLV